MRLLGFELWWCVFVFVFVVVVFPEEVLKPLDHSFFTPPALHA